MITTARAALAAALLALTGCGGGDPELVPVSGTISVDGTPTAGVGITFVPIGETKGNGGGALSGTDGRYEAGTPQGKKGLLPGKYRVVFNRRLNPDGSAPDPNTPPIESPARETLAKKYSDKEKAELTITVTMGELKAFDFAVQSEKKK